MKFCKHRVMDRCRKKGRPCTFSKNALRRKKIARLTADRIRAMSDKELAGFIEELAYNRETPWGDLFPGDVLQGVPGPRIHHGKRAKNAAP